MGRIVGVDYGTVRIGVSISDETRIVARALTTVLADKKTDISANKLIEAISHFDVEKIIVGLPLKMNGKKGSLGDEVQHFVDLLKTKTACPVQLWDERLTTVQAERVLRESRLNRKKRSKIIDEMTAVILLQSFLDSLRPF